MQPADDGDRTASEFARRGRCIDGSDDVGGDAVEGGFGPSPVGRIHEYADEPMALRRKVSDGGEHLVGHHLRIVAPEVVAEAEIHSYQTFFGGYRRSWQQERRVSRYLHSQTEVRQQFSASRTPHRHGVKL